MKSKIIQPMKFTLLRAALFGVVTLSAAAQWSTAEGAIVRRTPRGTGSSARFHEKPAQRPVVNPGSKPELIQPRTDGFKVTPNAAPRIAVVRQPNSGRNLEIVAARLQHELFSHRWSFVYAASLKHAPKSIRFLQNGTVETDLKGEKWYWLALDGRRVSLRSLADANQPGIILEFNEGYTNFHYGLPNQMVAVQGAPLDAIAEGPENFASDNGTSLERALVDYQWVWNDTANATPVRFLENKTFRMGRRFAYWKVTGPRTMHVEFRNGEQKDLVFDEALSSYSDGNQISGSRVAASN
jgi:hypothetical protein